MKCTLIRRITPFVLMIGLTCPVIPQSGRKVIYTAPVAEPKEIPKTQISPAPEPNTSAPQTQGVLRVDTTLIPVPVAVTDGGGRYVPLLKQKDFVVYEDGIRQEIAHFSDDWVPFHIVLMLDTSDSSNHRKEMILDEAAAFIDRLRPDDRVMVANFEGNNKVLCEFTNDRAVLRDAIGKAGKDRAFRLNTSLNAMLQNVVTKNLAQVEGRKAVVLFTDGMDQETFSCSPSRQEIIRARVADTVNTMARLPQRTFNLIEENGVIIYPVVFVQSVERPVTRQGWPGTPTTMPSNSRIPGQSIFWSQSSRDDLKKVADFSAGKYFYAESLAEINDAFTRIADDLGHQYMLGYYPTKALLPGQTHRITVNVISEAAKVRARPSYRVPAKENTQKS